jgi:lipopolysaccharide export system protein LptC
MAKNAEIAVDVASDASSSYRKLNVSSSRSTRVSRRYGRFVGFMRVFLPTIAAALIVIVAMWPQFSDQQRRFSITPAKVDHRIVKNLTMVNGVYTGVDEKRRPYTVTSDSVSLASLKSPKISLTGPKADILMENGAWVAVTADAGKFHKETKKLDLIGNVSLFHDSGYEFRTQKISVDLAKGSAHGDTAVKGQGPFGSLESQGFRAHNRGERVVFTGKAKLVLYPGKVPGG